MEGILLAMALLCLFFMHINQNKTSILHGTDYREIHMRVKTLYDHYRKITHRRPYVRSAYFSNEKIFIDLFWKHLWEKNWRDRICRLKLYPCALELLQKTGAMPTSKQNPNKHYETLYRFTGQTPQGLLYYVQVKEDTRNGQKIFVSVFPEQIKKAPR